MTQLDAALARIDELLATLKSGALGTGLGQAAAATLPPKPAAAPGAAVSAEGKQSKKERKGNAAAKEKSAAAAASDGDSFDKAHLAVGRVSSVSNHPSGSEKLWLCKVDMGDGKERQVVAGLKQHISQEDLVGRLVVVVLNLKPAKLAGEVSEAEGDVPLVRVLSVPDGCQPGDLVHRKGGRPAAEYPKECKSKVWKEVLQGLTVMGGIACFQGIPLIAAGGPLTVAADVPDGVGIH